MLSERATGSRNFHLRLKPYLCIIEVILRAFTNMYTRAIFVQSIITVKPKYQCASNKDLRTHTGIDKQFADLSPTGEIISPPAGHDMYIKNCQG